MFSLLQGFHPSSVLIQIGPLTLHWYGLLISIGAILGLIVVVRLAKGYGIKKDLIYSFAFWVIIFGLIGDRLYYVLYAWEYYSKNLLDIFKIWEGGLAIHGAIIAGAIVIILYARKHRLNPWLLLDLVVMALILGLAIGRWGNYFNQELFGKPTSLPWGIPIDSDLRPEGYRSADFFHPTFLYESLWNLAVFVSLFIWHKLRIKKIRDSVAVKTYGYIGLSFLILYSIGRGLNEFLRIDYSPYIFGIRWAQFTSGIVIIASVLLLTFLWVRRRRT